jgi:predicted acyltransferase (DUF342 family)
LPAEFAGAVLSRVLTRATARYDKMTDGNGGVIKAKDGTASRKVNIEAGFVGGGALTLRAPTGDTLVFKREVRKNLFRTLAV